MVIVRDYNGFCGPVDQETGTHHHICPAHQFLEVDHVLLLVAEVFIRVDGLLVLEVENVLLSFPRGSLHYNPVISVIL